MKKQTINEIKLEVANLTNNLESIAESQQNQRKQYWSSQEKQKRFQELDSVMEIVVKLHQARKDANLTQKQLAEMLNTSQSYIANIENGRKNISINTFLKYLQACGKRVVVI